MDAPPAEEGAAAANCYATLVIMRDDASLLS